MTGTLVTSAHETFRLPALLEWDLKRTGGVPCDAFTVTCLYSGDMAAPLHLAVSLLLSSDGGRLLLHGLVDEYTVSLGAAGRTVTLSGRGYAARLLDNESRPLTYQAASLADIVRGHVTPYGISCTQCAAVRASSVYTVEAGESQWKALSDFCRTYGGFTPSFTAAGELRAAPVSGTARTLTGGAVSVTKRENHYAVLSEVLVIDKTRQTSTSVKNADYLSRGGQRRHVVYTPGQSTWSAMRYTGEYQIAQSKADEVTLSVTLPGCAECEPGDSVTLALEGISGTFRAEEVEYCCGAEGETTVLTLKEK